MSAKRISLVAVVAAFTFLSVGASANDNGLLDAARAENWERVRESLADGAAVDAVDADANRAIHWAVRADAIETVELLLTAGADATAANFHGVTPLYLAVRNANAPMMEVLLRAGADANQVDVTGETMLMIATQTGKLEAVRALLAHGAEVDAAEPRYGLTPMIYAARDGQVDIIEALLARGARVSTRSKTGETPSFRLPCINGSGCGSHGLGIIRGGLPERGDRAPIPGAMTPLMYASREGHLDAVQLLVDAGADVNAVDKNDISPLMLAISNNRVDVARYLIDRGANPHAVDWYGRTPLWLAVEMRNVDIHYTTFEHLVDSEDREELLGLTRELLDLGVDPNVRVREYPPLRLWMYLGRSTLGWVDFTGQTAFLRASLSGDVPTMRLLLEYGADPHIPTFEGTTPLMAAAGINWVFNETFSEPDGLFEAVELCYELGMDVNAVNSMGLTAVMGAANRGSDDIIQFLFDKGARLDVIDNEGRTPMNWAAGVFLATHAPEPKPTSMALIRRLMGEGDVATADAIQ